MRWLKLNQNKLYKKYEFDPHAFLIRKAKLTKTFVFLLKNIKYSILKKAFVYRKQAFKLKRRSWAAYFLKNKAKKFRHQKRKNKKFFLKTLLKSWNYNFWSKFKNNYFNKNFSVKKKHSSFFFLKSYNRVIRNKYTKLFLMTRRVNRFLKFARRKRRLASVLKLSFKLKRKKLMARITWLNTIKFRKKKKTWWLLRVTHKKVAFFYGILKLKKFRYINNLSYKGMALTTYYNYKLECMINMVLFRLNFFDNIFICNNFIKTATVLVNNKPVSYPYRFIKVNDVIKFQDIVFKKMFNIFLKRIRYNKNFFIKRMKKANFLKNNYKVLHLVKNFINVPPYIEYNYKIMHFMIWRLPKESELLGFSFKHFKSYDWAFDTQLQYN